MPPAPRLLRLCPCIIFMSLIILCYLQMTMDIVGRVGHEFVAVLATICAMSIMFLLYTVSFQSIASREPQPRNVLRSVEIISLSEYDPHAVKPNCSFSAFRLTAKYSPVGYLEGHGTWKRNSAGQLVRFYPAMCNLQYGLEIPGEKVTSCLRGQNTRYIVILGDSNGMRYFNALHWHLSQMRGFNCTPIGKHNVVKWSTYEQKNMHIVHRCRCGAVDSARCTIGFKSIKPNYFHDWLLQARCLVNASFSVAIEFVSIRHTMEKKNSFTNVTGCQPSADESVIPTTADTSQRFFLAELFADPRPDLFMVFGNAHDRGSLREISADMDAFAELVDQYLTPPTRLIWLSKLAEDVRRKPEFWRKMRYENATMSLLEYLSAVNRIMYNRMRRRFLDTNKLLLFPDLLPMSEPVLGDYNLDGVHMKPAWYRHTMSYILQSLCTQA